MDVIFISNKPCSGMYVGNKGCLPLFHEKEQLQVGLDLIYQLCNLPTSQHIETRQLYIVSFLNTIKHIWLYVDLD